MQGVSNGDNLREILIQISEKTKTNINNLLSAELAEWV